MSAPTHVVVMGVSGCGKSTLGAALATELGAEFGEADLFHPKANVDKMAAGHPLTDEDRWPWLDLLVDWMNKQRAAGHHTVVSCSALRKVYRDRLRRAGGGVVFVHLAGDKEVILGRMRARQGHFMPPALLDSQYDTLEQLEPVERSLTLGITNSHTDNLMLATVWVSSLGQE
ncbi:MAG: gluconokinase [Tetrasphaera sp.]